MTEFLTGHDLTQIKLDKTREDVRRLHPLLQMLDPEQDDLTTEFADRLIQLLLNLERQLSDQTALIRQQSAVLQRLEDQILAIEGDLAFMVGEPTPEAGGSN